MNIKLFSNHKQQVDSIVEHLKQKIKHKLNTSESIIIAVSGGKSPIELFKKISVADLPFNRIFFTLIDERIISTDSADSNENLVKKNLLINSATKSRFLGLYKGINDNLEIQRNLNNINFKIDIGILGMGEDGHFASIFKCSKEYESLIALNNKEKYLLVNPTSVPYQRISLTLRSVLEIPELILSINGIKKLNILKDINQSLPIHHLLKNRFDIPVFWYEI